MKLDEEKLYEDLTELDKAVVFLLKQWERHKEAIGALCNLMCEQRKLNEEFSKFTTVVKDRFDYIKNLQEVK